MSARRGYPWVLLAALVTASCRADSGKDERIAELEAELSACKADLAKAERGADEEGADSEGPSQPAARPRPKDPGF